METRLIYRVRRENLALNILGLSFAFVLGGVFFGSGVLILTLGAEEGMHFSQAIFGGLFGLVGAFLIALAARGGCGVVLGKNQRMLCVTEKGIEYLINGKHKKFSWPEIEQLHWIEQESDNAENNDLHLRAELQLGKKVRFDCLDFVLPKSEWASLRIFLLSLEPKLKLSFQIPSRAHSPQASR